MKIITWNVNGIRAVIKKGFYDFMKEHNPDLICLQETKANKEQVELQLDNYKYQYYVDHLIAHSYESGEYKKELDKVPKE